MVEVRDARGPWSLQVITGLLAIAGTTWFLAIWLSGTALFGLLALLSRGRKRLTPAPLAERWAGSVPDTGLVPRD